MILRSYQCNFSCSLSLSFLLSISCSCAFSFFLSRSLSLYFSLALSLFLSKELFTLFICTYLYIYMYIYHHHRPDFVPTNIDLVLIFFVLSAVPVENFKIFVKHAVRLTISLFLFIFLTNERSYTRILYHERTNERTNE